MRAGQSQLRNEANRGRPWPIAQLAAIAASWAAGAWRQHPTLARSRSGYSCSAAGGDPVHTQVSCEGEQWHQLTTTPLLLPPFKPRCTEEPPEVLGWLGASLCVGPHSSASIVMSLL